MSRLLGLVTILTLILGGSGCASFRPRFPKMPLLGFQAIPKDATAEQVCRHLNENVVGGPGQPGVSAWESHKVRVHLTGVPVSLPATLTVRAPRDLRLRISHPMMGSDKADLGSNAERFWFWAEDGGPKLFTARHEHAHRVARQLQIPFEPDWVIDALGVRKIDPRNIELRPTGNDQIVELAEPYRLPDGHRAERIRRVNLRDGEIIGHELRCRGRTIAEARINEWTRCRRTQRKTPRAISLRWPEAGTGMSLRIAETEINPRHLTTALFEMPRREGIATVDLSQRFGAGELLASVPQAAESLMSDPSLRAAATGSVRTAAETPPRAAAGSGWPGVANDPTQASPPIRTVGSFDDFMTDREPNPAVDFGEPVRGTPVRMPGDTGTDPWGEADIRIDAF